MAASARRRIGAYAKLLANYAEDDAIIEAGEKAELLFVRGLAFCADSDQDGFISDAQLRRIVGVGMRDVVTRASTLVKYGLWTREDGGYVVRSWTRIHETAEERGRRRKLDRERKASERTAARNPDGQPAGIPPDSAPESAGIPVLIQSSTEQSTTEIPRDLEGERNETLRARDATPPPRYCEKHPNGTEAPCAACGRARQTRDQWERDDAAERRRANTSALRAERLAAAAAIRACELCDERGYRIVAAGEIGGVCNHQPLNRGGLARAQAAIAEETR